MSQPNQSPQQAFDLLCDHFRKARLLSSTAELLEWDERTGMPLGASEYRAEQVAHLSGLAHRARTDEKIEHWLSELDGWEKAQDPHGDIGATLRLLKRDFDKDRRLPSDLVEAIAKATVRGQGKWDAARKADNYAQFKPALDEMISLQREAGQALASDNQSTYEALLDQYEPDAKADHLTTVFAELRKELIELIGQVQDAPKQVDASLIEKSFDVSAQRALCQKLSADIGFDYHRGRLDETSHPFCTTPGPSDCRILTRYEPNFLATSIFGTLHEAGHGLYEQGLREDWFGLPPGSYASLGIHESQSRLWENLVGRSLAFWQHFTPLMRETFPSQLGNATATELHACFNRVTPSLIRVEADEATYNLHIIIRFELEQALIAGDLSTDDLPGAWNDAYEQGIGVRPPSDADGVLQDVHWSAGLFGYFPTYTLGNLAAAQLYRAAEESLGDLDAMFAQGEFSPLLGWLRDNIHTHGRCYTADQLVEKATGQTLSARPLMQSLKTRYQDVYGI